MEKGAPPAYPDGQAYPQAQPYPPQPQAQPYPTAQVVAAPAPTVVVQQPAMMVQPVVVQSTVLRFGEAPVAMQCPNCRASVQTGTRYELGTLTWLACFGLFWFTGCCCWIPFVVNGMKDVVHFCPSCQSVLGRYNRM